MFARSKVGIAMAVMALGLSAQARSSAGNAYVECYGALYDSQQASASVYYQVRQSSSFSSARFYWITTKGQYITSSNANASFPSASQVVLSGTATMGGSPVTFVMTATKAPVGGTFGSAGIIVRNASGAIVYASSASDSTGVASLPATVPFYNSRVAWYLWP